MENNRRFGLITRFGQNALKSRRGTCYTSTDCVEFCFGEPVGDCFRWKCSHKLFEVGYYANRHRL